MTANRAVKIVLGIGLAMGAVLVVVYLTSYKSSDPPSRVDDAAAERQHFEEYVASLDKAGEIVRVEQLQTPPVDPAKNAALTLRAAADQAEDDMPKAFEDFDLSQHPTAEQWKTIDDAMPNFSAALTMVDQAETQPEIDWQVVWNDPIFTTLVLDVNPQRGLAMILAATAMNAHRLEHDDEAIHRITQILMIARSLDSKPFRVTHVSALHIAMSACEQIEWLSPSLKIGSQNGQASPARVQQLIQDLLADDWVVQRHHDAMISDRLWFINLARVLGEDRVRWSEFRGVIAREDVIPEPTRAQIYTDAQRLLPYWRGLVVAATAKTWPEYEKRTEPIPPELRDVSKHPLYAVMPNTEKPQRETYETMARMRVAATTLALRAYAADHDDQLPPTLEKLVPIYLSKVPTDPIAENTPPLVYAPKGDVLVSSAKFEKVEDPNDTVAPEHPAGKL